MQISFQLGQAEIEEAIREYVKAKHPGAEDNCYELSVSLSYTRGDRPGDIDHYSASVSQRRKVAGKD